jgi:hypothetical protein
MTKPKELVFAPGCFDNFDGTQEELNELIAELKNLVESGDLEKLSTPLEDDDEFVQEMMKRIPQTRQ